MEKKIEDFLHLYYHSKGELTTQDDVVCEGRIGTLMNQFLPSHIKTIKPILRPLSDMTEEEQAEVDALEYEYPHKYSVELKAFYVNWHLKKGFDLFGLIESGLAISKVELSNPKKNVE